MTTTISVSNDGDHQSRFAALRAAIGKTPSEAMESYRDEVDAWERIERA